MSVPINDNYCFACGQDNPFGLKLEFSMNNGKYTAAKILPKEFQGYNGIAHGGILTTMLDEAMAGYLNKELGEYAVTARLDVRYRRPAPIGEMLTITAWEESRKGNFVNMKAAVTLPDGSVATEASGKMAILTE